MSFACLAPAFCPVDQSVRDTAAAGWVSPRPCGILSLQASLTGTSRAQSCTSPSSCCHQSSHAQTGQSAGTAERGGSTWAASAFWWRARETAISQAPPPGTRRGSLTTFLATCMASSRLRSICRTQPRHQRSSMSVSPATHKPVSARPEAPGERGRPAGSMSGGLPAWPDGEGITSEPTQEGATPERPATYS